jgi:hypothetical protein
MDDPRLRISFSIVLTRVSSSALSLTNFSIVSRSARLLPAPSLLFPSRSVHMPQRPRPLPPRSPPSSSRESAVSRRKLALLRLDVSFPSGMASNPPRLHHHNTRLLHQFDHRQ